MSAPHMVPLRIDWTLSTPWCPSLSFHLDGLIGFALVQEALVEGRKFTYESILEELPFEKHHTNSGWVWKASMIRPLESQGLERRYMTAKTNVAELVARTAEQKFSGRPLAKIDMLRGEFKPDAFWYTLEHAEQFRAWCIGDPDRLNALLNHITNLGKHARLDEGRVHSFNVEEDEEAQRHWMERNMPEPVADYAAAVGRLRPPYWMGEGATTVWRPL